MKARSPLCRTEPSARGVAPATVLAARSATGGRAAGTQDVAVPADKRRGRCESWEGRIVNRPQRRFHTAVRHRGGNAKGIGELLSPACPPTGTFGWDPLRPPSVRGWGGDSTPAGGTDEVRPGRRGDGRRSREADGHRPAVIGRRRENIRRLGDPGDPNRERRRSGT